MKQYTVEFIKGEEVFCLSPNAKGNTIKVIHGEVHSIIINEELIYRVRVEASMYHDIKEDMIFGSRDKMLNKLKEII